MVWYYQTRPRRLGHQGQICYGSLLRIGLPLASCRTRWQRFREMTEGIDEVWPTPTEDAEIAAEAVAERTKERASGYHKAITKSDSELRADDSGYHEVSRHSWQKIGCRMLFCNSHMTFLTL